MNAKELIANIKDEADIFGQEFIDKVVDDAFELSQKYCPEDTGHMKSTGKKNKSEGRNSISYSAPYSLFVHEMSDSHIKTGKNPNARSQFLKQAINEAITNAIKEL